MISRVIVFPTSIALTTFPTFSYYGAGNRHVLENIFSRSIKYLAFVMTPTAVFFVAFSRDVLGAWLGAAFASQSTALLQILTVTFLAHAFAYVPLTAVQGLGRADLKAKLDLVEVPLFLALLYLLIRVFGLNGAGVAKLAVTLVDVAFLFWFTEKIGKFSLRRMVSTTLAPTLCLSALLAAGAFPLLACGNLAAKAALFAVFVSIYAVLFWRMAFDGADKKVVYGILQKIRRKGR
jgi:O-antigen/teichoic acid export membrane protein